MPTPQEFCLIQLCKLDVFQLITIGLDQPVDISPNAQKILQGDGGEFKSAVPLPDIAVSAQKALELANKVSSSDQWSILRPPLWSWSPGGVFAKVGN